MDYAICLPIYNEEDNLRPLVNEIAAVLLGLPGEKKLILAVDDKSLDRSLNVLKKLAEEHSNLRIIEHRQNQGMAAGIRSAIKYGQRSGLDFIITMDADLTHDPADLAKFIEQMEAGADLVIGSRYVPGGRMEGVAINRQRISQIASYLFKNLLLLPVNDLTSGYRAMRMTIFDEVDLLEKNFCIQLEMVAKAHYAGFEIKEVPIILSARKFGQSKMRYNFALMKDYGKLLLKLLKLSLRKN